MDVLELSIDLFLKTGDSVQKEGLVALAHPLLFWGQGQLEIRISTGIRLVYKALSQCKDISPEIRIDESFQAACLSLER